MNILHHQTDHGGSFYLGELSAPAAQLVYRMAGEHKLIIDHTEVSEIHRGEGIGKLLVQQVVQYAREHHLTILPICPFAKSILQGSKEYEDVLTTGIPPHSGTAPHA